MHIIKLNAIGSTNTFLKDLVLDTEVKNYTVITADSQTQGRGQMGTSWESEAGKNLMFSVFVAHTSFDIKDAVYLNYAISLAVCTVLSGYNNSKMTVKWPNDILSDSKKISGLLIENAFNASKIKHSIIGVGVNVNQEQFSEDLKMATSLKKVVGETIDKEDLLYKFVSKIKKEVENCVPENFSKLKARYLSVLYKYQVPAMFKLLDGTVFMGKIVGVNASGALEVERDDESIHVFGLKQVKMLL